MMEVVGELGRSLEQKSVEGEVISAMVPGGASLMVAK